MLHTLSHSDDVVVVAAVVVEEGLQNVDCVVVGCIHQVDAVVVGLHHDVVVVAGAEQMPVTQSNTGAVSMLLVSV